MEILSYVLEGALAHKDSTGGGGVIRPGDVQRMSAGTGVMHSEFNASRTEPVHFLQIWLVPGSAGIAPGYEQKSFPPEQRQGQLRLIASPDAADGSLTIHQDARVYTTLLGKGDSGHPRPRPGPARLGPGRPRPGPARRRGALGRGRRGHLRRAVGHARRGDEPSEVLLFDLA